MIKFPLTIREKFYAFIRSRMTPLDVSEAEEKKKFWAKCYLATCVCIFGYVVSRIPEFSKSKASPYEIAKKIQTFEDNPEIRVIKYSGLSKVSDHKIPLDKAESDLTNEELSSKPKGSETKT